MLGLHWMVTSLQNSVTFVSVLCEVTECALVTDKWVFTTLCLCIPGNCQKYSGWELYHFFPKCATPQEKKISRFGKSSSLGILSNMLLLKVHRLFITYPPCSQSTCRLNNLPKAAIHPVRFLFCRQNFKVSSSFTCKGTKQVSTNLGG